MASPEMVPVNVIPRLPRRAPDGHKGLYGKVLVVAGSRGMAGAATLTGQAALRAGAGLVQVACPISIQPVVAASHPCYTTFGIRQHTDGAFSEGVADELIELGRASNVLAIGPGLGMAPDVAELVQELITALPRMPTVIDADGLNAIAPMSGDFGNRPQPMVLTPHPGEFARLAGVSVPEVVAHRQDLAVAFAAKYRVVLLLKGMGTLVTDGRRLFSNSTGNPGMATGGSGDVLTGVIAAMLGIILEPFEAAVLAAWVHGRAADLAAGSLGQTGLVATDLLNYLPAALRELEHV